MTIPDAPLNLANNAAQTDSDQIGLTWDDGAANGGSVIIDYRVTYDSGSGNYVPLATGVYTKNFIATGLSAGTTYAFKIESRNQYGYSGYSS